MIVVKDCRKTGVTKVYLWKPCNIHQASGLLCGFSKKGMNAAKAQANANFHMKKK